MASPLYFVQECPTCGRNLQIRVVYLGRNVVCQHCHGKVSGQRSRERRSVADRVGHGADERADELLESISTRQLNVCEGQSTTVR